MKKWEIRAINTDAVEKTLNSTDLSCLTAEVMSARGYNNLEEIKAFFNGTELSDPFLLPDMDKAVETINQAIENGETICIYGDYDCDGVTSTAILYDYFMNMGIEALCYIPERSEGYGLNMRAIDEIRQNGATLIVTVDNGITAVSEADYVYQLGMKLVITDHHQPAEALPRAEALVDPYLENCKSEFKDFAGVGVALKLLCALEDGGADFIVEQYADICALGTIADIVPLVSENRTIVNMGLKQLKYTEREGLTSLIEQSGINRDTINSSSVAFFLAPRINAAGRFGSAITALDMLVTEGEEAVAKATELSTLNDQRKQCEAGIISEIGAYIAENPDIVHDRVIVLSGKGWHHGVIGIVAARLLERYERPVLILSIDDNGFAVGSARSIAGFNIFKCFDSCKEILVKYGGHECAGGLTVKESDIQKLREMILDYAKENFPVMPKFTLTADKLLRGKDITEKNIADLARIEPYGAGNPEPLFALSGAAVLQVVPLKRGEHTKLEISYDGVHLSCLMFRRKTASVGIKAGDKIDLMGTLSINEYNGKKSFTLTVTDYRLHGIRQDSYFAAYDAYESFRRGEDLPLEILRKGRPSREELVSIYKYAFSLASPFTVTNLSARLGINCFKLSVAIDAFCETGLFRNAENGYIELTSPKTRVDIESSKTLHRLDSLIEKYENEKE
ncbi:MAG: single-stranded-DNA-specific exonuclease RecJ [Oscillospiraceae bacterium]|nr:single-stranded-DNA-specific exonuclease RecJ [Oscillospiraceae bacterium]